MCILPSITAWVHVLLSIIAHMNMPGIHFCSYTCMHPLLVWFESWCNCVAESPIPSRTSGPPVWQATTADQSPSLFNDHPSNSDLFELTMIIKMNMILYRPIIQPIRLMKRTMMSMIHDNHDPDPDQLGITTHVTLYSIDHTTISLSLIIAWTEDNVADADFGERKIMFANA